jgi:hypothetical protein
MRIALFLLLMIFVVRAQAVDLEIVNDTGHPVRLDDLGTRCAPRLVTKENPIHIPVGGKVLFEDVIPVVHTYTVCSMGFCSSSAIGFKKLKHYKLNVIIEDGQVSGKSIPEHFPGNIECPAEHKKPVLKSSGKA